MNTRVTVLLLLAGVLAVSTPALAHHGNAAYDGTITTIKAATVTKLTWANPHTLVQFDVKDDKDHAGHWSGELLPNPAQLIASGWTRKRSTEMLKAGTAITVTVAPARAGGMVVLVLRILNDKGEELLGAAPPPGAVPRPGP